MVQKSDYVVLRLHKVDLNRLGIDFESDRLFEDGMGFMITAAELKKPLERFAKTFLKDPMQHPFLSVSYLQLLEAVGKWQRLCDEREGNTSELVDSKLKVEQELVETKERLEKEETEHLDRSKKYVEVCNDLESAENKLRLNETALAAKDATIERHEKRVKALTEQLQKYQRRFEVDPSMFRTPKLSRWQKFWAKRFKIC